MWLYSSIRKTTDIIEASTVFIHHKQQQLTSNMPALPAVTGASWMPINNGDNASRWLIISFFALFGFYHIVYVFLSPSHSDINFQQPLIRASRTPRLPDQTAMLYARHTWAVGWRSLASTAVRLCLAFASAPACLPVRARPPLLNRLLSCVRLLHIDNARKNERSVHKNQRC